LNPRPRLLFYVQHLLGIGHVQRAARLAAGWCRAGIDVAVVCGGEPVAGVDYGTARCHQLPPLRAADAGFSALVDRHGEPPDAEFKARRREQLLQLLAAEQPQLLVIESYPFGRRQLRWELQPLLQAADRQRPRPLILCSLRDILQRRRPQRVAESLALSQRYMDHLLVHGDPAFIALESSLPEIRAQAHKLIYTGYVANPALPDYQGAYHPARGDGRLGEVLVSAGGGAVGYRLLQTALAARALSPLGRHPWRLLVGPNLPPEQLRQLRRQADGGVTIEPLREDFPDLLSRAALSISQGGYNTLMDLLGVGCPALLVPFEGAGETEQLTRCQRLQQLGMITLLREQQLTPAALATAIEAELARPGARVNLNCAGVDSSARQLLALCRAPQADRHG